MTGHCDDGCAVGFKGPKCEKGNPKQRLFSLHPHGTVLLFFNTICKTGQLKFTI